MSGRLLLIEARRSLALWLVPPLLFLCFRTYGDRFTPIVPLWIISSVAIGQAATIIGPPLGGIAAWMAGRERRRGAGELLATTARPPLIRLWNIFLATTSWGLLIYVAFALGGGAETARRASWGGPDPWIILAGAAAIVTYSAIGFALGAIIPGRFVAPLVAIGLWAGQSFFGLSVRADAALSWLQFFSQASTINPTVWFGGQPAIAPFLALSHLRFVGAIWILLALRLGRFRVTWAWFALVLMLIPMAIGVTQVRASVPQLAFIGPSELYATSALKPYTPVCQPGPIEVCVHPAYRPWLGELSSELNLLLAPLVGVPGMPTRAEQVAPDGRSVTTAPFIPFQMDHRNLYEAKQYAADCAVVNCSIDRRFGLTSQPPRAGGPDARAAIARWLRLRLGRDPAGPFSRSCQVRPGMDSPCLAAERFAALDPATQRAWLEAHFADLRAGRLTLADLP